MSRTECSRRKAVCRSRVISNRHPFARPVLPGVNARLDGSDSRAQSHVVAFSTLDHGCPPPADQCANLPGIVLSQCQVSHALGLRGVPASHVIARHGLFPARRSNPSAITHAKFWGFNTFKLGSTHYLGTSPALMPTHRYTFYQTHRTARFWACGARLPRRYFHPL